MLYVLICFQSVCLGICEICVILCNYVRHRNVCINLERQSVYRGCSVQILSAVLTALDYLCFCCKYWINKPLGYCADAACIRQVIARLNPPQAL